MSDQTTSDTQVSQDSGPQGPQGVQDSGPQGPLVVERLTITTGDSSVYVNEKAYHGIDLSWIPKYNDIEVHAVQWYNGNGEIELKNNDPNIKITELGIYEKAIDQWKEKHQQLLDEIAKLEEQKKLDEENANLPENINIDDIDIEALLSQL